MGLSREEAWALGPGMLGAVAAGAAIRGRVRCEVRVPVVRGRAMLPSVGEADFGEASPGEVRWATARTAGGGAEIHCAGMRVVVPAEPGRDGPGWRALRTLEAAARPRDGGMALSVVLDDLDPHRVHDLEGAAGRVPDEQVRRWRELLTPAWETLVRLHRGTAEEIAGAVRALTPLVSTPAHQLSATAPEAFGAVALSLPRDSLTLALTLAHEVQHAKLAALAHAVRLTEPDDGTRYYAPWRDDPRPLHALLQGTYAHLGVLSFWGRQRGHETGGARARADTEFARWRLAVAGALDALTGSGRLTPAGERFAAGMRATLRRWMADTVPVTAASRADTRAARHRRAWESRNR
ncbi:aKG-HExxH-type peptide beta-hydroxylase [Bailinhaonella thermotolerans]|uniref:aKG-HExxH-type peptide beta-hydroxylase n=1 Tax=Bailinhaonella thermotolerans TaxID=1070861 RepID=UPI001F5C0980|nr:HEXXH motif-containing putative peptide modification protein [Bailinhaonella thermotolerans]